MNNLDHIKSLAQLVTVANADRELVDADDRYVINVEMYHTPSTYTGLGCAVCVAGCVIAKTLDSSIHSVVEPWDFDKATEHKLEILDLLRKHRFHQIATILARLGWPTLTLQQIDSISKLYLHNGNKEAWHQLEHLLVFWETMGVNSE